MPNTMNKTRAEKKTRRPARKPGNATLTPRPWYTTEGATYKDRARSEHVVETWTLERLCNVRLDVFDVDRGDPDACVRITVTPLIHAPRYSGEYLYPVLRVRASELDDLVATLALAVAEGRRAGVLPKAESHEKAARRLLCRRDAAGAAPAA